MNNDFTPAQLNQHDLDRLMRYRELLDFYRGQQWHSRAVRGEKHLILNYAKVVIDKVTSYLSSVARNLPSSEITTGRRTAVLFFDEHNPKEAVVIAVYS